MVREAYKPRQSEKLAKVMLELAKSTAPKPKPMLTEHRDYL